MRILTVRQPWAWAIIHGGKDVENRVRNIAGGYRGPVLIHAAQQWDDLVTDNPSWEVVLDAMKADGSDPYDAPWQTQRGVIIGVVDLVDVHAVQQSGDGVSNVCFNDRTPVGAICSPWAHAYDEFDSYRGFHMVLATPRPLAEPIAYKGALGLRNLAVNDPATTARILAQIGETA